MINDESPNSARSLLNAAVATALDRLDRLVLANGALQHLARHALINHREAMGVDTAAARIAQQLVDKHLGCVRQAVGRLSQTVAVGREPEALRVLSEFTEGVIESLTFGNIADVDRRLIGFSYEVTRLSAPSVGPRVPLHADDLPDDQRRGLVARGWNSLETQFLTIELMRSREALAAYDATGALTAGGRRITRQWLREVNAPLHQTYREKFLNSLPPLLSEK